MNQQNESLKIKMLWQDEYPISHNYMVEILNKFGELYPDPLRLMVDLHTYADKLLNFANILIALHNDQIIGFLAIYTNNKQAKIAYIPLISVSQGYQRKGIGTVMLSRAIALARQTKMKHLWLRVKQDNEIAIHFYSKHRFVISEKVGDKYKMDYDLTINDRLITPQITPFESGSPLSSALQMDIDLRIKRDDLYPLPGGSIKARKIGFIVKKAIEEGYDALVTNGGPQSNHARATAILAANIGIKCHLVIVLEKNQSYNNTGNILLMKMSGASIEFTSKDKLAMYMDKAIKELSQKGHKPMYIWGGGHSLEGTHAFVNAAHETQQQAGNWIPDYVFLASGTGSTQAGLVIGYKDFPTQIIGISVARTTERGTTIIQQCIDEYSTRNNLPRYVEKVVLRDDWIDGGYEKYSSELFDVIDKAAKVGYFFDPTYSGKALRGFASMVNHGEIPKGKKVLFWHTGGLMNLMAVQNFMSSVIRL
jgi:1-aminocyclopropane-1-carboxylate deaminase/D-cysteine desulfhydrase-like pyridoxal-dependent ACC family enzyme/ribosomal protein S18 acetylase RimI-like enzyme